MKSIIILLLFSGLISTCYSQDILNGTVLKSDGKPSKGTEVRVMGSKNKMKTNKEGKFYFETLTDTDSLVIKVSKNKDLIFLPGDRTGLKITLGENSATLTEGNNVYAVSYRQKTRNAKSSNIITSEDIVKMGSPTFLDAVKRIPGVNMVNGTLAIRGINSFNSSTEPLFILDGSITSLHALESIDINTIESIEVNKTGFGHGSRGANGAISVKTKLRNNK